MHVYILQVSNFVIGLYFLSVVNRFGISKVYLGFATVCLLAVLYIAGNVVETKGRSLEEIERALSSAAWLMQVMGIFLGKVKLISLQQQGTSRLE